MSDYDSTPDTLKHIKRVNELLTEACMVLLDRAIIHDASKLVSPEKEVFDKYTPKLKDSTYGSNEYKSFLEAMNVGLKHHYKHNSHHPEHYEDGIDGMDLFDLIEMLIDWKAAGERHTDGSLVKSLQIQKDRFKISPQLQAILENTQKRFYPESND